jgi:hypothetical protein
VYQKQNRHDELLEILETQNDNLASVFRFRSSEYQQLILDVLRNQSKPDRCFDFTYEQLTLAVNDLENQDSTERAQKQAIGCLTSWNIWENLLISLKTLQDAAFVFRVKHLFLSG